MWELHSDLASRTNTQNIYLSQACNQDFVEEGTNICMRKHARELYVTMPTFVDQTHQVEGL